MLGVNRIIILFIATLACLCGVAEADDSSSARVVIVDVLVADDESGFANPIGAGSIVLTDTAATLQASEIAAPIELSGPSIDMLRASLEALSPAQARARGLPPANAFFTVVLRQGDHSLMSLLVGVQVSSAEMEFVPIESYARAKQRMVPEAQIDRSPVGEWMVEAVLERCPGFILRRAQIIN